MQLLALWIYFDSSLKVWFVPTLLLATWFGALINCPITDRCDRKGSVEMAVVIFSIGSSIQASTINVTMAFFVMDGLVHLSLTALKDFIGHNPCLSFC